MIKNVIHCIQSAAYNPDLGEEGALLASAGSMGAESFLGLQRDVNTA